MRQVKRRQEDFGVGPGGIIPTGGSNLNAPDHATPPDVSYTVYWKPGATKEQKKEFIDYARGRLDLKV